jgi:hypothetical protein
MNINRRFLNLFYFAVAASAVVLSSGCLEFTSQTLTYRYDPASDTLRMFQCYKGIFGGEKPEGLTDDETPQLDSLLTEQRTFFFANWIFEFNRTKLAEPITDTKLGTEADARAQKLVKLLVDNVTVKNGPFYLENGKLCGVQEVTVKNFSKIIAAANASISDYYKSLAGEENVSAEDKEFYLKAAASPGEYFKLNGNQITFKAPMPKEKFDKMYGRESESSNAVAQFKRGGGKLSYAGNELMIVVGEPGAKSVTVSLPVFESPYSSNVLEALKKKGTKVLESFDAEKAAREFVGQ